MKYDIQRNVAQNDVVVVYTRVEVGEKQMSIVDLRRIRDGFLAEHWDCAAGGTAAQ